jgi:hypothetical protein
MAADRARQALDPLDALVGEWSMRSSLTPAGEAGPRARSTFAWLAGRRFLIQRWEVDHPDAPDGIAVIGFDEAGGTLLQHSFDSRGVARVYTMSLRDGVWTLERRAEAPDFCQRFEATVGAEAIAGRWETSADGTTWQPDFGLTYTRVR